MSKADERLGPLRRIVRRFEEDGYTVAELECGHRERVRSRGGDTYKKPGASKRCSECLGEREEGELATKKGEQRICPCCKAKLNSRNNGPLCSPCKEAGKVPPRRERA